MGQHKNYLQFNYPILIYKKSKKEIKMSLYSTEFDLMTAFLNEEPSIWATNRDDLFKDQGSEFGGSSTLTDDLLGKIDGQCLKGAFMWSQTCLIIALMFSL